VIVSKIDGLKDNDGKECNGWLIGIPMTAKQMMENQELAKEKIILAIKKAENLGAKIVGLGALTSSVTNGGEKIKNEVNIKITSGNALTAGISYKHIQKIIEGNGKVLKIGIVGATGSIGSALVKLLVKNYPEKEFFLFAKTKENLEKLEQESAKEYPNVKINGFLNDLNQLKNCDLDIIATASPNAFIKQEQLKNSAIIYDITQPQNISIADIKKRLDLKVYDGGLVLVPELNNKLPLGLPKNTVFACLGETMLLAIENESNGYSLGKVQTEQIDKLLKISEKHNFKPIALI
jgi:predicted amino acid dehydrogenase